jgi:alpha-tubulin suppressor-like RCC1 family protein
MFIREDDELMVWGNHDKGSLGIGNVTATRLPHLLNLPPAEGKTRVGVLSLSCGCQHTVCVTDDNRLLSWGLNDYGQLGIGSIEHQNIPQLVSLPPGNVPVLATCGALFSTALTDKGTLFAWGDNSNGQLGQGNTRSSSSPLEVTGLPSPVIDVACGHYHILVILENGDLYVWGRNSSGELGLGHNHNVFTPFKSPQTNIAQIACASCHSFTITTEGALYACGWNGYGGLGHGGTKNSLVPHITIPSGVAMVTAGGSHSMAILEDGTIFTFGQNTYGQLGHGDTSERYSPTKLNYKFPKAILGIGCLSYVSFVILEDGSLYLWGCGQHGEQGRGSSDRVLEPLIFDAFKVKLPVYSPLYRYQWGSIYKWLFLGRVDTSSEFYGMPVELIFHFVSVTVGGRRRIFKVEGQQ